MLLTIPAATVVLDSPRVRVFRTADGSFAGVDNGPSVVISLDSATAVWMDNVVSQGQTTVAGSLIIVQPRSAPAAPAAAAPAPPGSAPGESPFKGMSFTPVFENDRVRVKIGRA